MAKNQKNQGFAAIRDVVSSSRFRESRVYSLAEQFHYPEQEIHNIIVTSMNGIKIGLEVGDVDEILEIPDDKVVAMPVIMRATENCFEEVASSAKELIVMLEVSKLMPETAQEAIKKLVEQQS